METVQRMSGLILRRPRFALIVLVIAALAVLAYLALNNKTPEEKAREELAAAVAAVGQLMVLPEGDEPVLAAVTDAEALIKQQAFFSGAVNGDQLLLFPKNLKAVIYSPSRNKIINAGPIEQAPGAPQKGPTSAVSAKSAAAVSVSEVISVEVRNGTDISGLGARVADEVRATPGFGVTKVADAGSKDHQKTILASRISGERVERVRELAVVLGAEAVESIPGEAASSADVLVVVGAHGE